MQPPTQSKPHERVKTLQALLQVQELTKQQVEELLAACTDTRPLPPDTQRQLGVSTVQGMAWKLLRQPVLLEHEALHIVLKALDSNNAHICEGATMLLQQSKSFPQEMRQKAAQKIWQILIGNNLDHRFSTLDYFELTRVYEALSETLKVITDHS